ncbi:MAG: hypothetical protein J0G30_12650 [Actinomycetales bacterium]|nr:hypothetical protein [Actinomycetales bacterium]
MSPAPIASARPARWVAAAGSASAAASAVLGTTLLFAVVALGPVADPAAVLAALATASLAGVALALAARSLTRAPRRVLRTVGGRAPHHREVLDRLAEPNHPDTTGRVHERAPGRPIPAA